MERWKKIIILMTFLMIPLVSAIDIQECKNLMEPREAAKCRVTSTWNYTPPCNGIDALVYNENGTNIINYTFSDYGVSELCNFTWNISSIGSYVYRVSNGDSGNIKVEVANKMISTIMGLIIVIAYFFAIALLNKSFGIKFLASALALIELIFMVGILYITEAGGQIIGLLRINFYIMAFVGFAIGMYTMYQLSVRVALPESTMNDDANHKWEGKLQDKW